ncbi:hypothetical protein ANN_22414 [Periplaneta americana]|uniref:PiggyBac transposable element-derived protein domain-containing protein n=1 Tax=Periplaneta americana TaxID=6978 RepID=A0ABQ8S8J9_PERAM|nr:hypothetical protein ANN_22414 [Periplaneta americana]
MDEEGEKLRNLIDSVEKEMAREEETRREAGAVRRQLFREEEIIRPIDSIESDVEEEDMVEEIDHNTDSAQSADEEVDLVPGSKERIDSIPVLEVIFTDTIIDEIVRLTNEKIEKVRPNYSRPRDAHNTTRTEMEAFIGLLYMAGVLRASHLNLFDLWSADGTGVPHFRTCMNRIQFKFLVTVLRFDDSNTRQERRSVDKLAPIRSLFEQIVQKCSENFTVSEYVTIDEMLESFRGRMVQPISGSRRNVTTDNWFTSVSLADELLTTHKLTLVGKLRKNMREVPPLFLQSRSIENSSVFGFTKDKTLVSYCPKKKKVVVLLSTMHHTDEIDPDSEESRKPYMLTFYNSTKGGVDMVDVYKARYSVARTSNRWPLTLFFTLLNIAGINSFIILKHNIRQFDMFRRKFLQTLSKELSRNYLLERLQLENLPRQLKRNIREITGTAEERNPPPSGEDEGPGRCHLCDWKKNQRNHTVKSGERGDHVQKVLSASIARPIHHSDRSAKKIIYKTILRPVVTYASEAWVLTINNENMLAVWEIKVLRKIYGPHFENGQFRSRTNKELMELYGEPSIVSFIKKGRLRWLGHLERMPEGRLSKWALYGHPGGLRKSGRPRLRWLQDVEDDLERVGCKRWRQQAQDRDEWFLLIKEAQALHGL